MNVPYPEKMHRLVHKLIPLLRASFLLLLMLGVMVRPMLNQMGALHAAEHVTMGDVDDRGHDYAGDREQAPDPDPDPDHTKGAHGLMHQADTVSSANIWTSWVSLAAIPPTSTLPLADLASTRSQRLASPFRPPIA